MSKKKSKLRRDFWEEFFYYPSFAVRFWSVVIVAAGLFFSIYYQVFKSGLINDLSDNLAFSELLVQIAALVLGIFAAFYAFQQLLESRFDTLDETGMQALRGKQYFRAILKWKEAFFIKPESRVLTNFTESFLFLEDFDSFDHYIDMPSQRGFFQGEVFLEDADRTIILYLKSARHLLAKNQGAAEENIKNLLELVKNSKVVLGPHIWNYDDLHKSEIYKRLAGECKLILDNLVSYLKNELTPARKEEFERGQYASQVV